MLPVLSQRCCWCRCGRWWHAVLLQVKFDDFKRDPAHPYALVMEGGDQCLQVSDGLPQSLFSISAPPLPPWHTDTSPMQEQEWQHSPPVGDKG